MVGESIVFEDARQEDLHYHAKVLPILHRDLINPSPNGIPGHMEDQDVNLQVKGYLDNGSVYQGAEESPLWTNPEMVNGYIGNGHLPRQFITTSFAGVKYEDKKCSDEDRIEAVQEYKEAVVELDSKQVPQETHQAATKLQLCREVVRVLGYIVLLICETGVWLCLYPGLADRGVDLLIPILIILPSLLSSLVWLVSNTCNKGQSYAQFCSIFLLLLLSIPSPIFLELLYLYEVVQCGLGRPKLRQLWVYCQLCHAFSSSLPLLLTTLTVSASQAFKDNHTLDLIPLSDFLDRNFLVYPGTFLSLAQIIFSVHLYNERLTSSIVTAMLSIPFTFTTVTSRLILVSIFLPVIPVEWILLLVVSIACANLLSSLMCERDLIAQPRNELEELDLLECCGCSILPQLPTRLVKAVFEIVCPLGYASDRILRHHRMRGATYILLNYLAASIGLGIGAGMAILYYIPNNIEGLELAQMGLKIQIPETGLVLRTGGVDLKVKLPETELDMSGLSDLSAAVNLSAIDPILAIAIPIIFAIIALPVTVARAAMLGMDCVVLKTKALDERLSAEAEDTTDHSGGPASPVHSTTTPLHNGQPTSLHVGRPPVSVRGDVKLRTAVVRARRGVAARSSLAITCGLVASLVLVAILVFIPILFLLGILKF